MNKLWIPMIAMAFAACSNPSAQDQEVTTDLINNQNSASDTEVGPQAEIEFEDTYYDFGEIVEGEKVKTTFTFTNTGEADLIISDAKGSCGCTVPTYPKQPIAPGEDGEIEVQFDSNGRPGRINKTVTLIANTEPNTVILAIKGEVISPDRQN